ncbi:sugar ABC transporter substrate-binding protein [Planctobacterium marinum]|uniref:sugar ABC transporter substrate-binding protein n=1 Tax=Planctobacterium marinum TaxID=1631968 RepID=UPI0030C70744
MLSVITLLVLPVQSIAASQTISIASSLDDYDLSLFLEEFKQQTGINFEFATLDTSDLKTELLIRADTKTLPDVVLVPGDLLGLEMVNYSVIPKDWMSDKQPTKNLEQSTVKGAPLGIPILSGNHLMLYYNKSLVNQPATSWQALIAQQHQLEQDVELIAWSYNEMFWLIPFLGAFDALPYLDGEIRLGTTGTAQALRFYQSLAEQGVVAKECHYQCSLDKFVSGKVAYMINGSWALHAFDESLGENLGVALLPAIKGNGMVPYSSVFALAFPGDSINSDKSAALKQLARFLQSDDVQQRIWHTLRSLPSNINAINRIKDDSNSNISNYISQLELAEPMPSDPEMSIIWEALVMGFNRHQGGALDASEAAQYMQYVAEKTKKELY